MAKAKKRDTDGLYRRGDSSFWWVSYINAGGSRVRRSTGVRIDGGTEAKKEAEAILTNWKAEAHRARVWGIVPAESAPAQPEPEPARTIDEVLLTYLEEHGQKTRSGESRVQSTMKHLYKKWTGRTVESITAQDVKAYIRDRSKAGAGPGTINKEIGLLSAACNWCREELGWSITNPAARRKLREPEGRVRWLTDAEAERLLAEAAKMEKAPWLHPSLSPPADKPP